MKVAIQGIAGSFHEQAAKEAFRGRDFSLVECINFRAVFEQVENGLADYGVVAIENSLHGSINAVYKLLEKSNLHICGEVRLHIKLYLLGHEQFGLDMVNVPSTKVFSQREALSQCETWLTKHLDNAQIIETTDTAEAVRDMMQGPYSTDTFAIASPAAARKYHAEVLAGPINDEAENYTRFFVITKQLITAPNANRTSIILSEKSDEAGKLCDALGLFAKHGINLSKIHSQPRPGERRLYDFYIDFDESLAKTRRLHIIEDLHKVGWNVQILGSYTAADHVH